MTDRQSTFFDDELNRDMASKRQAAGEKHRLTCDMCGKHLGYVRAQLEDAEILCDICKERCE